MLIKDLGGEFALIKRISKQFIDDKAVIKGIGDDCAVIDWNKDKYFLVTTDMMVENDHFKIGWSTPKQIGLKLMESNVSDIISMGGKPKFAVISICIRKETTVEFIDGLYDGIYESARKHGVFVVGGDVTHGTEYVLNLALTGEVDKKLCKFRSGAKMGDLICVTGYLGGSTAGLKLLIHQKTGYLKDHLEPRSRLQEEGEKIAKYADAMIDVSDGLGSEVKHICEESALGGVIFKEKIPLSENTVQSARSVGEDPYDYALYGGEDYQLVFTIPEENIQKLKKEFSEFTIVGKILPKEKGVYILENDERIELKKGYDHFS